MGIGMPAIALRRRVNSHRHEDLMMIDRRRVRRYRCEIDDAEDRAVGARWHADLRLRAIRSPRYVDRKFVRHPQQRHAIAAGCALLGLQRRVKQHDGLAVGIMSSHDPARRPQFHFRLPSVAFRPSLISGFSDRTSARFHWRATCARNRERPLAGEPKVLVPPTGALSDSMESEGAPGLLLCRILSRNTGTHFCGKCSNR
jgi:hypothetical protein